MRFYYTDEFVLPLPPTHRFPMQKYTLLRERIMTSGVITHPQLIRPAAATDEQLLRVHSPEYLRRVVTGELTERDLRRLGFPWSPELVERSRRSSGATIEASRAALSEGCAVNLAGGTHHAYRDRCEGFCLFNDSVVAARELQASGLVSNVLVIDCDVHQGNGTASLVRDDPTIYAFSIHSERNYPQPKEVSDLDIGLPDGTEDAEYLAALQYGLKTIFREFAPDMAIYLAGADPYHGDRLGRLALSLDGLGQRDRMVLEACRERSVPVAISMAGGYCPDISQIVDCHFQTVTIASQLFGC
ncbi:histone deacetylase [Schlesneria sp. DSM 10557]|uniref:histone deacetylase family protein n=1 Tax=Schlesneria sp. DSM 10557 TaxID=3044399 RepID=UPI00359FC347